MRTFNAKRCERLADLLPVHDDHGKDRAGLDRNVEDLGFLVVEAKERARKDEVAGARNRQELGEAFDDAHHGRLGQQHQIHLHSFVFGTGDYHRR
jgi:hypothetical protein